MICQACDEVLLEKGNYYQCPKCKQKHWKPANQRVKRTTTIDTQNEPPIVKVDLWEQS